MVAVIALGSGDFSGDEAGSGTVEAKTSIGDGLGSLLASSGPSSTDDQNGRTDAIRKFRVSGKIKNKAKPIIRMEIKVIFFQVAISERLFTNFSTNLIY